MAKKSSKKSKKQCQKIHCLRRLRERFGIVGNRHWIRDAVLSILNGKAVLLEKVSKFKYTIDENTFILVYDKIRKNICTVLTEDMYAQRARSGLKDSITPLKL